MVLSHGVVSWAWAGAMEVQSWSGFGVEYIRGQELVLIHQFLMLTFTRHFRFIPFVSFAMCRSHTSIKI